MAEYRCVVSSQSSMVHQAKIQMLIAEDREFTLNPRISGSMTDGFPIAERRNALKTALSIRTGGLHQVPLTEFSATHTASAAIAPPR